MILVNIDELENVQFELVVVDFDDSDLLVDLSKSNQFVLIDPQVDVYYVYLTDREVTLDEAKVILQTREDALS